MIKTGKRVWHMKIAIVEDEENWCLKIREYLCRYCKEKNPEIDVFYTGQSFLTCEREYALVFMDVELGEENGFEISAEYQKMVPDVLIIILTTHTELSRFGYRVNAFRYIDKQCLEEIDEALVSAEKRWRQQKRLSFHANNGGLITVLCKDIVYIEAEKHNIILSTRRGDYVCHEKISDMEEKLKENGFYLIHRAYLVNMSHVAAIHGNEIQTITGKRLPISRRKVTEFRNIFMNWKLEQANG